ncbi:trehalose synthase (Ccg-9) [Penicillium cosmopolitanum]|uniref:Trehalose synthase (Ccg-9) n=1 Tax=Penicillium cosmopolitanum TaxID=1131564 RepID=A0A9W9W0C7_9EURO|nr:trehalose synthase (Ccg-9) [Penicillium cosmopolitanum]KAJ5394726.1 trehalose synthase (Ccg-9) [Penicillium cosmopolitanum]
MYQPPTYGRPIPKHKIARCQLRFGEKSWSGQTFDNIYVGISGVFRCLGPKVAIAISKSNYLVDYLELEFTHEEPQVPSAVICDSLIAELENYSRTYLEKIVGVALPNEIDEILPDLCSRLWMELDCIPLVLGQQERRRQPADYSILSTYRGWNEKHLDEQADSMVRKCIRSFGVGNIPHLDIGDHGIVNIDTAFHVHLSQAKDFQHSVTPRTWSLVRHYATDLTKRGVRIAIFSATAQGNAAANATILLLRLSHCLDIDMRWFDGLNKNMKDWDLAVYGRQFHALCRNSGITAIDYPNDKYIIVEMANTPSFQHALTVLQAYNEYYDLLKVSASPPFLRKLLLCVRQTHGNTDGDFYASVASHIASNMKDLEKFIAVTPIKLPDQIWNTLLSKAELVILFSDSKDCEGRFLEAVQKKNKTIIRTEGLGPYASLVEINENVFTVGIADFHAMGQCLFQNLTLQGHRHPYNPRPNNICDEITTTGNAVNWLFLASALSNGDRIEPNGEYIYRLAQGRMEES